MENIILTPGTKKAIGEYLELKKDRFLSGHVNTFERMAADEAARRVVELLMASNPDATGLTAMLAEIDAIKSQDDDEQANRREALALDADLHINSDKPAKAYLAQTLQAMRLERKYEVMA